MSVACDLESLTKSASPLQSIDPGIAPLVIIYLLQKIAGNTMTPQQLITAVNGYQLIRSEVLAKQIQAYLLCQIANEV